MIMTIKKQYFVALALLLAIPVVLMLGGALFSFINPEIAARTSNYVRNWHLLNMLKMMVMCSRATGATSTFISLMGRSRFHRRSGESILAVAAK